MYDLGVSYTFPFLKKITESSIIFLRNGVLILNGKEKKEAGGICFEIRIPRKIYRSNFSMKKQKHFLVCKYFQISAP